MIYNIGQFINLKVMQVSPYEILLTDNENSVFKMPTNEQSHNLSVNSEIFVIIYQTNPDLLVSMNLEKHANKDLTRFKPQQEVDLFIIRETPLGFKCIIDGEKIGMLYKNEVFTHLKQGDQIKGHINKIRPDNKIDLILRAAGHKATQDIADKIIDELKKSAGFLPITDKTEPEEIYRLFNVSKKKFKIALGGLYKSRMITITDQGIKLN